MLEKKEEEERKENTMREGKFLQLEKERKHEEEIVGRNLEERKKEENELFAECIFLSDSDEEETVQEVKKVVEEVDLDDDEPIIIVQGKVVEGKGRGIVEVKERRVVEEEKDSQQDRQEQYFPSKDSNHDYNTNCNIIVGIGMLTPILEDEEDDYNSSITCEVSSNDDCKISSLFLSFQKLIRLHISISPFSLSFSSNQNEWESEEG